MNNNSRLMFFQTILLLSLLISLIFMFYKMNQVHIVQTTSFWSMHKQ